VNVHILEQSVHSFCGLKSYLTAKALLLNNMHAHFDAGDLK